jgi:hypothetical protein
MANDKKNSPDALTAFTKSLASLRKRLLNTKLDAREFARKLSRCSLQTCRGTCCYDGASVDDDTADVIQQLSFERSSEFAAMGLTLQNKWSRGANGTGRLERKQRLENFHFVQ